MSIELKGLDNVIAALEGVTPSDDNTRRALGKACAIVERSAKQKAPKGSGELRRSITSRIEGNTGIVYTPLEYAPYVEFGTGIFAEGGKGRKEVPWVYVEGGGKPSGKKTVYTEETANEAVAYLKSKGLDARKTYGDKPSPYMRPALHENRENILKALKDGIKE
jgi:HK97 gp10 family phage protein